MKEVRIGIIGVGNMGTSHTNLLLSGDINGAKLTAVCDINPERLKAFEDREGVQCFESSKELIRSGAVDAVAVATPHYDHTTIGSDALKQGLHVLVEKPISVHKADCEKLIAAYDNRPDKKQVFSAMFNQRTDPVFRKVKELLEAGELGELLRVNWIITNWFRTQSYYDGGGWRATWEGEGGGVLLNQCPHQLDLLQWLCGKPARIRAFCGIGKRHNIEVEDDVTAYLEYDNGATGVFISSTGEAPGTNRLEICGERGKMVVEGEKIKWIRTEVEVSKHLKECEKGFAQPPAWHIEIPVRKGGLVQHRAIFQNFVNAILKGDKLIAPGYEGIHSVEIGNAMLLSSLTGKTIELPMNATSYARKLKQLIKNSTFVKKTPGKQGSEVADLSDSF